MKKLVISLFIVLLSVTPAVSETLRLVTFDYYPTMYTKGGRLRGCAVDIVKEAFRRMNRKITIEKVPMKRGQHMLRNGEADGMFTLYRTPERTEYAFYPESPVLTRQISFYVRSGSQINFEGDISGMLKYSVGTVIGYSYGKELDNYIKNDSFKRIDPAPGLENTVRKLVNGRFDIMPHTKLDMIHLLKKMKFGNRVRELTPSIAELPVYLVFTKKKKYLAAVAKKFSDTVEGMKKDGIYEKLLYNVE